MVLSFYLLQAFRPQTLKFARRKEQTQPIQTQRFPLLARLCESCLVHCWCFPRAGPMSVSASATLRMHPGCGAAFGGEFFCPQMCTKLRKFQRKNSSKKFVQKFVTHFSKIRPLERENSPTFSCTSKFLTDTLAQRRQHNPAQMQRIFE